MALTVVAVKHSFGLSASSSLSSRQRKSQIPFPSSAARLVSQSVAGESSSLEEARLYVMQGSNKGECNGGI